MPRTSREIVTNKKKAEPTLSSLGLLKVILVVFVLIYPTTCQAAIPKSGPIKLSNKTQENYQIFIPLITQPCTGNCYYVDSANGSDANSGTSINRPWRTLAPVNSKKFLPGDIVQFKRGSSWSGGLVINDSGQKGKPITFTTYGTGPRPVFTNPGDPSHVTHVVKIFADWIIVEGLLVRDAQDGGIFMYGSNHSIVRDIEATNVGRGIIIKGQDNLITGNYVHDLHMVHNDPGGDDDFGAIGISLSDGSYNEIAYNTLDRCIASSYDYGTDGTAVEWWGNSDGNYVHNNWANEDNEFLEVSGGSANDTVLAYNVSYNNHSFFTMHLDGSFASVVKNFQLVNNTFVEDKYRGGVFLGFDGDPTVNTLNVENNIFYIDNFKAISNKTSFTHDHNLYYLGNGTVLGYDRGAGELIADPSFISLEGQDFQLSSASPAINTGVNLGYSYDFGSRPVPVGKAPDIGAFEYQGQP